MKTILFLVFWTLSFQLFADCSSDFSSGISEYNFAANYFEKGRMAYNKAIELSNTDKPVFLTICNLLVDSVAGFFVAKDSYSNCSNFFSSAMNSCLGDDSVQAANNKSVCLNNYGIAQENHEILRKLLKDACFKSSLIKSGIQLIKAHEYFYNPSLNILSHLYNMDQENR